MAKWKFLLVLLVLLQCRSGFAQNEFTTATWYHIDTSIAGKTNLASVSETVMQLRKKAMAEKKYFYAARCYWYQLKITDQRTEDSLYFKNSAFLDTLLAGPSLPASLQYCLEMLLAKRIQDFTTRYNRFQGMTYERKDIPVNYGTYTFEILDSLAHTHFNKAKELSKHISLANIDEALWLSSDPLQFLYKPGLIDLAVAEEINGSRLQYPAYRSLINNWFALSPDNFIAKLDSISISTDPFFKRLQLFREWLSYHESNKEEWYFIETLAHKFTYNLAKAENENDEKKYEQYLQIIVASPYSTVKAHAVYQLCLLWNSQSNRYFPDLRYSLDVTGRGYLPKEYGTVWRYHSVRALELFRANRSLMDSFSYLKSILLRMEGQIQNPELTINLEENNLPDEPLLAELRFKNVNTLYYRLVRVNADFESQPARSATTRVKENELNALLKMPVAAQKSMDLPATGDYNYHGTYIRIDPLPAGRYAILFSSKPAADSQYKEPVYFNVTNIAIVNNDTRVYVLNRKTGLPLAGAVVTASDTRNEGRIASSQKYTVNKQGFIKVANDKEDDLRVTYGSDTARERVGYEKYEKPDDIYDKDEYEDMIEYYDENAKAYIYTDRGIYRPGQTVYYKAIFITKNKKGEPMVMSRQNLGNKLFSSVYKKWLKEMEPLLMIKDPFFKEMDSIKIIPNEYGSVSGSFKIPVTAATGDWTIEPDYIEQAYNTGEFKVEEYKRPTYEITIDKPATELLPGDSFSFKIKVKSFAGAALNNVKVEYSVNRSGTIPKAYEADPELTLVDTTGYTDADGQLEVKISDAVLKTYHLDNDRPWSFTYRLDVSTVDGTGESYDADATVYISSRPTILKIQSRPQYERNHLSPIVIEASDRNAGTVTQNVTVKVYSLEEKKQLYSNRKLTKADIWVYDLKDLQRSFPYIDLTQDNDRDSEKLVYTGTVNTTTEGKLEMQPGWLPAGKYKLVAQVMDNGTLRGETERTFVVFDEKENRLPEPVWSFYHMPYNSANKGETLTYYYGNLENPTYSIFHVTYFSNNKQLPLQYLYEEKIYEKGIHQYQLKIPSTATQMVRLTQVFIVQNQLFTHQEDIYINDKQSKQPGIVIERYRKKLSPGSKETFSVTVKTGDENVAAELMTTMYDASLDKLNPHNWVRLENNGGQRYIDSRWEASINSVVGTVNRDWDRYRNLQTMSYDSTISLWWLNPLDFNYDADWGGWMIGGGPRRQNNFQHDMNPDMAFTQRFVGNTAGLNEVIVVGYGVSRKSFLTGSVSSVTIRGMSSISAAAQPLIVLDGIVYKGDVNSIDASKIISGMVLKGADAAALYGAQAAQGVLILSTKGQIVLPAEPEPVIVPRKNFSETAFFFPAIHADRKGFYSFSFTMPESVTEWNWKIMAHTRKAISMFEERKLTTQLPLMVQPNMPRLLYQGDRVVLQNRISNLDTADISGKMRCRIIDEGTGEDITSRLVSVAQQDISLIKKSTLASSFEIKVPADQLNPLKVIVTVSAGDFGDGEEHIISVLSPKILVRDNHPFTWVNATDTAISLPSIPAADMYGVGLSIAPKPQAALINSLPYLANYPYGCAEQTFNKLLANITALQIMRTDTAARNSFSKIKESVEKENNNSAKGKLPAELAEETVPWLNLSHQTEIQQKQLFALLDTSRTVPVIEDLFKKLREMKTASGGMSWFNGGETDFYISCYVMRGFGELKTKNQLIPVNVFSGDFTPFISGLIKYCDAQFSKNISDSNYSNHLYYIYSRSHWAKSYPVNDSLRNTIKKLLLADWKQASVRLSLQNQALLSLSTLYFSEKNDELYSKAISLLRSQRESAINDEVNGLRWKDISDADDLVTGAEETVSLLGEAFEAAGMDDSKGIIKWLLSTRTDHHWSSTKATAAVLGLLENQVKTITGSTQTIHAETGNGTLTASDDLFNGNTFQHTKSVLSPSSVKLSKTDAGPARGNIGLYYFSSSSDLSKLNKNVQLSKQFYKWSDAKNAWEIISVDAVLKIADRIRVVIKIESAKPLSYVYIDDKRAAAFEPADNSSGYEYGNGFTYYQSVRDAGLQFFIDFIPSGRHEIEYEVKVAQEGNFMSGPAFLQCMYKPEVTAYSNSMQIKSGE